MGPVTGPVGPSVTGYREAEGPPASSASKHLDLAALASAQHGVVSGKQLHALGFSPQAVGRLVAQGRLARLHVGVYAVGHLALTSRSR